MCPQALRGTDTPQPEKGSPQHVQCIACGHTAARGQWRGRDTGSSNPGLLAGASDAPPGPLTRLTCPHLLPGRPVWRAPHGPLQSAACLVHGGTAHTLTAGSLTDFRHRPPLCRRTTCPHCRQTHGLRERMALKKKQPKVASAFRWWGLKAEHTGALHATAEGATPGPQARAWPGTGAASWGWCLHLEAHPSCLSQNLSLIHISEPTRH